MQILASDVLNFEEPNGVIEVEPFQGCCGVYEIYSLENFASEKEADALIKAALENAENHAIAVYTTNQNQPEVVAALERAGFDPVANGKNNESTITLWVKVITKVPAPRKRR